jgi:sugar phosphate isomerase/epimerase
LHEAVLRASLDVAAEFGALHYVVHTGISGEGPDLTSVYARQRERLARAGDFARERNLIIVVENVFTKSRTLSAALPSELARELIAIAHPSVKACLDFSHAFIHTTAKGADFLHEAKALAPLAKHLHVHDSFGRRTEILTYSAAERLAFGQGDLHLPVGWGAIPWADLMRECRFADGVVFNIELEQRYQAQAEAVVAATRELVRQAMSVGQA